MSANKSMTHIASTAIALSLIVFSGHAFAWGSQAHQIIATLADAQISPATRLRVQQLLDIEPDSTLVSISKWADETRNPSTANWHYVNFPRDSCRYLAERDCPEGKCVVGAIEHQTEVLKSNVPADKKLAALKYIVHLVGDVHQPLHAGYLDDKGGNTYQLQAFMRGTNLHAFWDSGMIRSLNQDADVISTRLLRTSVKVTEFNPIAAAEESCQIVGSPGYYPDRQVGQDYIDKFMPTLERRLLLAGARLAALLNQALQ